MRIFELTVEDSACVSGEVDSPWALPGVQCSTCGETWANVGVAYPTVSLAALEDRAPYEDRLPVSWARFLELRDEILDLLPVGLPAPPGTSLGPMRGELEGTVRDLMWPFPWTVLCRAGALLELRTAGLRSLKGVASPLRLNGGTHERIVELEVEAHGELASSHPESACSRCGRREIVRPEKIVLKRASLSVDVPLFRLQDLTTAIFAAEPVVRTLERLGLKGWQAEEVEVA